MNAIQQRISDAIYLWDAKRFEGAFLMALVALSACAAREHPNKRDGERFELFFSQKNKVRLTVEYRGELHSIERIFYKYLRCSLVHEGTVPVDVKFVEDEKFGMMSVRAGGAPDYTLHIGKGWFSHIITTIA